MEERLKELKEKITSFVNDYDIQEFTIWIEENRTDTLDKDVLLEIRVEEDLWKIVWIKSLYKKKI